MPFDALIVSLAVTAVFVGFAATLGRSLQPLAGGGSVGRDGIGVAKATRFPGGKVA